MPVGFIASTMSEPAETSDLDAELGDPAREPVQLTVEPRAHGWRVDHYLSRMFPNFSRGAIQRAIEQESVLVNGLPVKPSRRLRVNDAVQFELPPEPDQSIPPEDIPLDIM